MEFVHYHPNTPTDMNKAPKDVANIYAHDRLHIEGNVVPPAWLSTNNGKIDGPFLANTRTHEVLHMSGFGWHSLRDAQLKWEPSIFGEVVWPNILEAAARPPAIAPALRECLDWFEQTLIDKGYMKAPSEYPEKNNLPHC